MQATMSAWQCAVLGSYLSILSVLSIYGLHRYHLIWLYYRNRQRRRVEPPSIRELPHVTVQLPIFNEATVAERLIDAVAALRYPSDLLEIQVLDDSTDDTSELVANRVAALRASGIEIHHLSRKNRRGYKAGALAAGLEQARGELVVVFDADFLPLPNFLEATVPYFEDPHLGMVQTRWGHLNAPYSLLTRVQAILLDAHFIIEHFARNRTGRFFNFNGTAGLWRRACIEDAGGWQHDTLTEDLDLSYRAQLAGWKFLFLPEVVAPAELPVEMRAFKTQQHRWAKGSIETALKLLPRIWRSGQPFRVKLEATFHLSANFAYLLVVGLCLLLPEVTRVRSQTQSDWLGTSIDVSIACAAMVSVCVFYAVSQRELYRRWWRQVLLIPALLCIGVGLAINNSRAVLEALGRRSSAFVRTPKQNVVGRRGGTRRYSARSSWQVIIELAMAAWCATAIIPAVENRQWFLAGFVAIFLIGFTWVAGSSILEGLRRSPGSST